MIEMINDMRDYKYDHTRIAGLLKQRGWRQGDLVHEINCVRRIRGHRGNATQANLSRVMDGTHTFTALWVKDICAAAGCSPRYFETYDEYED